jgi:hypothetical protein
MKKLARRANWNALIDDLNDNFAEAALLAGEDTLVASQILSTGSDGKVKSLAVATYPSLAELAYVKGVTSSIQTQLTGKAAASNAPVITHGVIAPASTPAKIGDIYVDTAAKKLYFAVGAATSADWVIAN